MFIFFIDEMLKKIYGNFINKLTQEKSINHKKYPSIETARTGKKIIYFPIENMIDVSELTEEQVEFLRNYSTRSYEYGVIQ